METTITTSLPVQFYARQPGEPAADWREIESGPGQIQLPTGEEFGLRARNLDDNELRILVEELAACPNLIMLNLSENRSVTGDGLKHLKPLSHLRILNLSSCSLTNTGLEYLKGFNRLVQLDLSYCNRITDLGVKHLRNLTSLKKLNLQGCVKVTNAGVAHIRRAGLVIIK